MAVVLKRASQALALGLTLRVVTFMVTMMPNPAEYCHGEFWNPPRCVSRRLFIARVMDGWLVV